MRKCVTLLLIVILTSSSLMLIESVFAQSMFEPSVPEFTLEFVDKSYDVPPTTESTTDPYTIKQKPQLFPVTIL